jgi:hypothetical protein
MFLCSPLNRQPIPQRAFIFFMKDMQAYLEKLLTDAEECALISKLATDMQKRALFAKLTVHLKVLAGEIERAIMAKKASNG